MPAHDLCGHFSRTTCERGTIREAKPGYQVRDLPGIIKTSRECKHDAVNMVYEPTISGPANNCMYRNRNCRSMFLRGIGQRGGSADEFIYGRPLSLPSRVSARLATRGQSGG